MWVYAYKSLRFPFSVLCVCMFVMFPVLLLTDILYTLLVLLLPDMFCLTQRCHWKRELVLGFYFQPKCAIPYCFTQAQHPMHLSSTCRTALSHSFSITRLTVKLWTFAACQLPDISQYQGVKTVPFCQFSWCLYPLKFQSLNLEVSKL